MIFNHTIYSYLISSMFANINYIFVLTLFILLTFFVFPKYFLTQKIQAFKPINIMTKQLKKEAIYTLSTMIIFTFLSFTVNYYLVIVGYKYVGFGNGVGYYSSFSSLNYKLSFGYQIFTFCLLFIWHDTVFFWVHKFLHIPIVFKHVHKIHHNNININPMTSISFHPIEAVIHGFWFVPLVLVLPISGYTFFVFGILEAIHTFYVHSGYQFSPKGLTRHWFFSNFASATHHNLHHQRTTVHYALYFTWWDRLLGSEFEDYRN